MKVKPEWRANGPEWALVTGGGGGIGLALSLRLASMGYNIVLADINADAMRQASGEITSYGVASLCIEIDLARQESARELYDRCAAEGISPRIVVNNAGIFFYNDVADTDPRRIETMMNLHVYTLTMISRLFGADMARTGRGYILNMSSYSVWMPWPGLALYTATKNYIRSFSLSLHAEMREKGVGVTVALPAGVTTGLYGLPPRLQELGRRLGVLLTPRRTADAALGAMFRRRKRLTPGFLMKLILPIVKHLPGCVVRFARRHTLRFMK